MTVIAWIQLGLGIAIVLHGAYLLVGSQAGAKQVVLVGCLNVGCAASILLWNSGSEFRTVVVFSYGLLVMVVVVLYWRSGWAAARRLVLLGLGTMLGLTALQFLSTGASPWHTVLLVATSIVAALFVGLTLVGAVGKIASLIHNP